MKKEVYIRVMAYFAEHRRLCRGLIILEKSLEILTVAVYIGLLLFSLYENIGFALRSAVTSLIALYICTLIRFVRNAPRPYEVYETLPAMNKDTRGQSFPSRHLTSVSVIAVSLMSVWPTVGVVFALISIVMAALRVLLGVHFIRDVVCGGAIGYVVGIVGVFLFPMLPIFK